MTTHLRAAVIPGMLLVPAGARAQISLPPITSRNFNIDLFEQPALGSPRLIALSGETSARLHGTAGFEARIFAFRLGGHQRRASISAASDLAARYKNLALSVGFWN